MHDPFPAAAQMEFLRKRWEHRDPPIAVIDKTHLVGGEELVMHEGVPRVYRARPLVLARTMHHVAMHPPLEEVVHEEHDRDGQPFPPVHVLEVRDVDVEGGRPEDLVNLCAVDFSNEATLHRELS